MNLSIAKDLYIFLALLLLAAVMAVVYFATKIVTKRCKKLTVAIFEVLIGAGFCLAIFGISYLLDNGVIRVVYPILAGVEFYIIVKVVDKIKRLIAARKTKVLDTKRENDIK